MLFDPFGVSAFTCCGFLGFFCYRLWQDVSEMKDDLRDSWEMRRKLQLRIEELEAKKANIE